MINKPHKIMDEITRDGQIGEYFVKANYLAQGFNTSTPSIDTYYDLIVDTGDELLKTQIKSISPQNGYITVPLVNRKNSSVEKNGRGKTHYYVELVDIISVYNKSTRDIYHIPTSELPLDKTSVRFKTDGIRGRSNAPSIEQYKS